MLDQHSWNAFVIAHAPKSGAFLQSYEWGEFQKTAGTPVIRFYKETEGSETLAQIFIRELPFHLRSAYIPRGPISENATAINSALYETLKKLGKEQNAVSLRLDPIAYVPKNLGGRKTKALQPETTSILDLTKSEEELLAAMHEKTRYNIRLAAKKGVTVREGGKELFGELWKLLQIAAARDKFHTHTKKYYEQMVHLLSADPENHGTCSVRILIAEYKDEPLAGMILLMFGNDAVYLHGGSSNEHRNLMAPYLLQWEAMCVAKKFSYKNYDLWGIAPPNAPYHPLLGVTRFKQGFAGELYEAPPSIELPIKQPWYTIYALIQKLRGR